MQIAFNIIIARVKMKNKPIKTNSLFPYDFDDETDDFKACSFTDCTGLIPSAPENEDELESYKEIYHYNVPDDI